MQADALELGDRFRFLGYRPDAAHVMSAFDIFCLASHHEGLPIALMEALVLGLPVVATDVGGIAELVTDGRDAVLVPAGNAAPCRRAHRAGAGPGAASRDVVPSARPRRLARRGAGNSRGRSPVPAGTRPMSAQTSIQVRPATDDERPAVLQLLQASLGWNLAEGLAEYFDWKHLRNPFGRSPAWVAVDGDRIVGFRTFLRWEFENRDGARERRSARSTPRRIPITRAGASSAC